jgi:hypothetical protein
MVQAVEAAGRCVYAVTFGNFHGDNYSQAIGVANALGRIRQLHKRADGTSPKVDVLAWSKGVLAVDAYLGNAAAWPTLGRRFFDQVAEAQGDAVPSFRSDVRVYVALSGPHLGIDLNFRHPIHTLTIASTSWNAPIGRGPMPWTWFSALQCVNWGPDVPWYNNPYAKSVCESRGGTWLDYFNRIYVSNLSGLGSDGKPVSRGVAADAQRDRRGGKLWVFVRRVQPEPVRQRQRQRQVGERLSGPAASGGGSAQRLSGASA